MDSAIQLYFGKDAVLPSLNNLHAVEIASRYRKTLYQIALMNLYEAKSIYKRPKFDKTRCLYFKDAFLALSAVWYLYAPMANELFGNERTQEAKDLCYMPDLEKQSEDVQSIVKPLLRMMKAGASIEDLFDKTLTMHTTHPSLVLKLRVLQSLFVNVIRPLNGGKRVSEADALSIWTSVFKDGLPLNTKLTLHQGDQGSIATKISRSILAEVFDIGTAARKCDTLLAVDGYEISNIEAKKENTPAADIAVQARKNAKINKSILLQLEKYEIGCPPFMNIHGMTATVNSIKRLNDIWVVGPACAKIILPKTRTQFQFFLERDVYVLFNLLDYYHRFADSVYDAKQRYDYVNLAPISEENAGISKYDMIIPEWERTVLHSPSNPVKSQRVSLLRQVFTPQLRQVFTTPQLRQVFTAPEDVEEEEEEEGDDEENNDDEKNNDDDYDDENNDDEKNNDDDDDKEEEEEEEEEEGLAELE